MLVVFVEAFHFGRVANDDDGRGMLFAVGVAEPSLGGTERVDILATGFRVTWLLGVGRDDCLGLPGVAKWPMALADRDFGALRWVELLRPMDDMMTEDGGELWGVSFPLAIVDMSFDSMLETESRSCCSLLSAWSSSTQASMSAMDSFSSSH
jgi:hypothetical protein